MPCTRAERWLAGQAWLHRATPDGQPSTGACAVRQGISEARGFTSPSSQTAPKPPKQGLDRSLDRDQRYLVPQKPPHSCYLAPKTLLFPCVKDLRAPRTWPGQEWTSTSPRKSCSDRWGRPLNERRGERGWATAPAPQQLLKPSAAAALGRSAPPHAGSRALASPIGSGGGSRVGSRGSAGPYLRPGEELLSLSVRRTWAW